MDSTRLYHTVSGRRQLAQSPWPKVLGTSARISRPLSVPKFAQSLAQCATHSHPSRHSSCFSSNSFFQPIASESDRYSPQIMSSSECPICFTDYDTDEHKIMSGACGHSLCLDCCSNLEEGECPFCKRAGSFSNAVPNYLAMDMLNTRPTDSNTPSAAPLITQEDVDRMIAQALSDINDTGVDRTPNVHESNDGIDGHTTGIEVEERPNPEEENRQREEEEDTGQPVDEELGRWEDEEWGPQEEEELRRAEAESLRQWQEEERRRAEEEETRLREDQDRRRVEEENLRQQAEQDSRLREEERRQTEEEERRRGEEACLRLWEFMRRQVDQERERQEEEDLRRAEEESLRQWQEEEHTRSSALPQTMARVLHFPVSSSSTPETILFFENTGKAVVLNSDKLKWKETRLKLSGIYAYGGGAVCLSGKIYALGDSDNSRKLRKLGRNKKWKHLADMNVECFGITKSCLELNGSLWVLGGVNNQTTVKNMNRYDPKEKKWIRMPDMKYSRSSAAASVYNGKIVICGGASNDVEISRSVECFDPESGVWTELAEMPIPLHSHSLVTYGNKLVVIGGHTGEKYTDSNWEFNPLEDRGQWRELPPMNSFFQLKSPAPSAGIVFDNEIYVLKRSFETQSTFCQIFNGQSWRDGPSFSKMMAPYPGVLIPQTLANTLCQFFSI